MILDRRRNTAAAADLFPGVASGSVASAPMTIPVRMFTLGW